MPLTKLCCILPSDTDTTRPKLRTRLRRALRSPCQCFRYDPSIHHQDSCRYEDTPGVTDEKKTTAGATNPRIFSYAELYIGTRGFSDTEILGAGGFGRVYRAVLPSDATVVAVKCVAKAGERFEKTFIAELVAVAQLRHRNLVRLRGWCVHENNLLLVYDYMPNRSLDRVLFVSGPPYLSWEKRHRIVSGLAAALFYLHEQLDTQIIHRDVKASNVMLDSNYNARLGDFGLARWLEHDNLAVSTRSSVSDTYQFRLTETSRIGGTIGYLPPESFLRKGSATAKSDVFSFGVVALEVATGRRAIDLAYPDEEIIMLDWLRRLSDLGGFLNALPEMQRLIHLGLLCTVHEASLRPTMKWVIDALSGDNKLPALPCFQSHPMYISLSSSSDTGTTTLTATFASSDFLTAAGSTAFLTAETDDVPVTKKTDYNRIPSIDTPREISYEEIVAITNNFDEAQMVAEIDFGTGYRGYIDNRIHVLVKRLGMKTCPALRARFSSELLNLAQLRHRNLVQLRGWCTDRGEMLVVSDYSSSGLLSHHLFHRKHAVLAWRHRYQIMKSLASAVLYLHEEWDEQVIHRNITSSAVFLDPDMNPRLGSFALAEFLSRNEHGHHIVSNINTSARGIFGYMSPEYMDSGEATTMADVYSYGVVVLEVVTGLTALDLRFPEAMLVERVRAKAAEEIVDGRLNERFDAKEAARMVKLGKACTRVDAAARPTMREIVSILDGNDELLETVVMKRRGSEEWKGRDRCSLDMIRRMKALGIQ